MMQNRNQAWLSFLKAKGQKEYPFLWQIAGNFDENDCVMENCLNDYVDAIEKMYGKKPVFQKAQEFAPCIRFIVVPSDETLDLEGFRLLQEGDSLSVYGGSSAGVLYGMFEVLRRLQCGKELHGIDIIEKPSNPLRLQNHWDNIDGSVERGYAGRSIFMKDFKIIVDDRTKDYARLCASVGINGVVINNVNVKSAATELINERYIGKMKQISDIFNGYGIKLYLSLNYAAPMELNELATADPCDEQVIAWWEKKMKYVYENIPTLGGFLVKADSEGRPGPFTYNRTHAQGANMLARALKPYGGLIIWRCFVYNCKQDWRDRKTDRARAGYDNFMPLDGLFDDNVILQIKNGPMDFQIREPISPLLGGLQNTNQILEVQAAQEYTGQQIHVCYLVPMWKEVLDFKTYCKPELDTVADLVSGRTYKQHNCGMAAVTNIGDDENWCGHDLAAANFYGFGRLSWNTSLTSEEIAREWAMLTFGCKKVTDIVVPILLCSREVYEMYSAPLGIGWMVNPSHHYGPNVDGYEYDRWGTYHRADWKGIGVDRTQNGTGYCGQYHEPNASMYESQESCPEELLLFFHYVEYKYRLKTGKTLIQHIYDTHFEGYERAVSFIDEWENVKDDVDPDVFKRVKDRLLMQKDSAAEWRDRVNTYFYRKSGIADEKNRVIY